MARATLVLQHQPGSADAFMVVRTGDDYKPAGEPAKVPSPYKFPVEGRPDSNLMAELRWYLETFLDYPFPPETDHADRVLRALRSWGEQAFAALFSNLSGGALFHAATAEDYSNLTLQVASDDPAVLSWPWEALRDPRLGVLAHSCQVERRLAQILDPPKISEALPRDCINILLVVARPYGEQDVRYRSIARPLVELIEAQHLPAHVDLLRPPTLARLREHLERHRGHYHILHFDGHGAYGPRESFGGGATVDRSRYSAPEGQLIFENEKGEPDPISAAQLNDLLRDYAVPAVVLNACQSGMLDLDSEDAYASVAATLLRAGMRSVVAMSYSLYVTGAQEFLPAFYRELFKKGSMAEAVRAGRRQMRAQNKRLGGRIELDDWLLPVLYQQRPLDFSFVQLAKREDGKSLLPEELRREQNPYGFIGRDGPLLALERAMRRAPAGILIQGLGGVGKTTLARGFLQWLELTHGLGNGAFWFDFREIRSAEYVFNRIGEDIFGGQFGAAPLDQKINALAKALHEHRFVIVWDNFESASGIEGTSATANLAEADRYSLAGLLDGLRGGQSKVIITSRSIEDWLGPQRRWRLPLTGLDGEERWEYCEVILRDLGLTVDRDDSELGKLMQLLGGHPLAMRVVLPQLEKLSAGQVAGALRSNLASLKARSNSNDPAQNQLFSALQFVEHSLPEDLRPLLVPIALHENYVDLDLLERMAEQVPGGWTRVQIDRLADSLANAGLLRDLGQAIYEMHPALTGYLRSSLAKDENPWARPFVDVMARLADQLAPLELHEQRIDFHLHGASFYAAVRHAERMAMKPEAPALTQALASWALNNRNLVEAERLFQALAQYPEYAADSYHQLGRIAQERRNFTAAEDWYRKSLAVEEKLGNEHGAASTYHQLGWVAQERRDFAAAEDWYRKSLAIKEKLGDEHGAAITYHQLGNIAYLRHDFAAAEEWYRKSLAIEEKLGDEHGAASAYHQLGMIAEKQGLWVDAGQLFLRSIQVFVRNDPHNAGIAARSFMRVHQIASTAEKTQLETLWAEANLGPFPKPKAEAGESAGA